MNGTWHNFRFEDPLWLLAAIPLAAAVLWRWRRGANRAAVFSSLDAIRTVRPTLRQRLLPLVPALWLVGLATLVVALARPQFGQEDYRVRSEGIAMALCLDRSGSMQAMDFVLDGKRVDRFAVVRKIFRDFVLGSGSFSGRPDDLIALIAFGGYVDALCPLTLDHDALAETLEMIQPAEPLRDTNGRIVSNDILDEETATAIGDALVAAVERLEKSKAKSNVVVLLSDGKQNTGAVTAEEAAQLAKHKGVRVYTIGIGSTGIAPFPVYGPDGRKAYSNQPVELDETSLRQIAKTTGGEYFNARDTDTLAKICAKIDALEKTEHSERVFTRYRELYAGWLAAGLALILLAAALELTALRTTPA